MAYGKSNGHVIDHPTMAFLVIIIYHLLLFIIIIIITTKIIHMVQYI